MRTSLPALLVAAIVAAVLSLPALDRLDGLGIDSLFWLRQAVPGDTRPAADSPTVVIALDEETYRRPPFRDLPSVMWTKQLAAVIDAVLDAGAAVVGLDLVYPTSVGKVARGYERDFLRVLQRGGREGRIVLGKVQHNVKPIAPHPAQSFAVGHEANIRALNLFEDRDGVIRHLPLTFKAENRAGETRIEPGMSLELAARTTGAAVGGDADGTVSLGGKPIRGARGNLVTLNFAAGVGGVPVYSLADLHACVGQGKREFLDSRLKGKTVLIGSVLDVEDRKLTSKRFVTAPEGSDRTPRCALPRLEGLYRADLRRDTIPGVFVHAAGVNNILRGDGLVELSRARAGAIVLAVTLAMAIWALVLSPARAALVGFGIGLAWVAVAVLAFAGGLVLPLFDPLLGGGVALGALVGYRATVSDRDKRHLRKVFSFYLPPTVIERLVSQDRLPELGGETREVTIMFSDIAGFTSLSEGLSAHEVAAFLNDYLTEMSDIVEAHGGFVDKFVADEITAVFGAPVDDPDHAVHAVLAAMASVERLGDLKGAFGLAADCRISARFGINSGELLVGNIGSRRRFNYTAIGDVANLGSRLEGANKVYGTDILVGERTAELCRGGIEFREIDRVRVVGRRRPVRLFAPLARAGQLTPEMGAARDAFSDALAAYSARRFAAAAEKFARLADGDPVARLLATRARAYMEAPPPVDWDGVTDLTSK